MWSTPLPLPPYHVGVDTARDRIYVGDKSNIQVLALNGTLLGSWPAPGAVGVAVAADGSLFVTSAGAVYSGKIVHYTSDGTVLQQLGGFGIAWVRCRQRPGVGGVGM